MEGLDEGISRLQPTLILTEQMAHRNPLRFEKTVTGSHFGMIVSACWRNPAMAFRRNCCQRLVFVTFRINN